MTEFRELAGYEACRLVPENQVDVTARDRDDYRQMLWVKLNGTDFKRSKPTNRRQWYSRVARNQAISYSRERQRMPMHMSLTSKILDSLTGRSDFDGKHFLEQLLSSPVANDVELLLKLIDHDFSVKSLWEFESPDITLRAYRYRIASARRRVTRWCYQSKISGTK